jgi:Bifunctional DNA primase/polymerase, N-terminal
VNTPYVSNSTSDVNDASEGIAFFLTIADKAELAALGWTPEDIANMKPDAGHRLIAEGIVKSKPEAAPVGAYALVGARLCERGYSALPVEPGTKKPGAFRQGQWSGMGGWNPTYSQRRPTADEQRIWAQWPGAPGVCVVAGPASGGFVAIDIDVDDPAIKAAIESAIPPTTERKRGQKRETLCFRGPAIAESPSFSIDKVRVCDVIGPGRQTVLPPTIHEKTGAPYVWTGPDALEDTDRADLPEITPAHITAIGEALRPFGWEAKPEHAPAERGAEPRQYNGRTDRWRRLNEMSLANLSAWVPGLGLYRCQAARGGYEAVPTWRASNTGRPIEKRKLNLKIDAKGIVDFGDGPRGYTAIDLVKAAQSCDADSAFDYLEERVDPSGVVIALVPKAKANGTAAPQPAQPAGGRVRRTALECVRASDLAKKPVPKRSWLIPGFVPGRNVTLWPGDGGLGKSKAAPPAEG